MYDEEDKKEAESDYQPPPQKSIEEILAADAEDESLRKYKEALLGQAQVEKVIYDASDPRNVIVKKLSLLVDGRDPMEIDLSGDITKLEKHTFTIKEGIQYKMRIDFVVQREIVHGLKYVQKLYKYNKIRMDKMVYMVGSYAPKMEIQSYTTPYEETPSGVYGVMARGEYTVSSLFTDDDKNEHLKWDWRLQLTGSWE